MALAPHGRPTADRLADPAARPAPRPRPPHTAPQVATYTVDRNINYTNVCVYRCRFCAFYRKPGDPEGYLLPFDEIGKKIEETLALHGTGILMHGGVHPDLPIEWYERLLRYIRSEDHTSALQPHRSISY